ncbi:Zinc/iron permease [Pseudomassariella vexata]|uniref:Zinc/iron permease n=1 Tax=Pseudomassariella vexata TaxID=1141098 RepID=A0A1Y2EB86_9PEZI|nr:Zinc/iron permease [Pseudomassariella vexata]ORY68526.1 Zinc/iron permease [Pseudomassariella vexata]
MSHFTQGIGALLKLRQDADAGAEEEVSGFQVITDCDSGNEYDGRMNVRISAIFVILIGSLLGALMPVALARSSRLQVPKMAFFIAKYFGSGVIIATAFMHLLIPAFEALGSPCLEGLDISEYAWAGGITFMTIMVMFTIELLVSHFDIFGGHDHDAEGSDPSLDILKKNSEASTPPAQNQKTDIESGINTQDNGDQSRGSTGFKGLPNDVSYPPGGEDHLGHHRDHTENDSHAAFAAQMTAIFILEFGVIFHSIFIGLTLAVAGEEFIVLYIVLVFHQTFEGLGLGSRLATTQWPRSKAYMPYLLATLYALSTPIAIAAGLGVRQTLSPGGTTTLIINGVFDAISAGILIYTGLVELLAHEFMFNPHMRKAGLKTQMFALGCVMLGGALMALLAKWA